MHFVWLCMSKAISFGSSSRLQTESIRSRDEKYCGLKQLSGKLERAGWLHVWTWLRQAPLLLARCPAPFAPPAVLLLPKALGLLNGKHQLLLQLLVALVRRKVQTIKARWDEWDREWVLQHCETSLLFKLYLLSRVGWLSALDFFSDAHFTLIPLHRTVYMKHT